jgi:hypothetical protein
MFEVGYVTSSDPDRWPNPSMHRVLTCLDLLDIPKPHILLNSQLADHPSAHTDSRTSAMSLSYLVSTAGHAQAQNDENPHDIVTLNQLVRQGARELQDRPVVGFAVPKSTSTSGSSYSSEKDSWGCEEYCKSFLITLDRAIWQSVDDR